MKQSMRVGTSTTITQCKIFLFGYVQNLYQYTFSFNPITNNNKPTNRILFIFFAVQLLNHHYFLFLKMFDQQMNQNHLNLML